MKKTVFLVFGLIVLLSAIIISCQNGDEIANELSTKKTQPNANRMIPENSSWNGYLSQTPYWTDSYNQVHVGEGCIDSWAFCDPRPIINPIGDELSKRSKYLIDYISNEKIRVSCYEKVNLTDQQILNAGIDPNYLAQVRDHMKNYSTILSDEVLPSFICSDVIPNYNGQTVVVKKGNYPIDYSTNPNGIVIYNIEIQ